MLNFRDRRSRIATAASVAALLGWISGCAARAHSEPSDILLSDFESSSYGDWTAKGEAFRRGPARGEQLVSLEIEGASGSGVASSELSGDEPTGTLTSPSFRVDRDFIAFLIAGGDYERDACVNLLVDGAVVRSATGWNSDRLTPAAWDVREYSGKLATIQIVDEARGGWGHLNVDRIVQTNSPDQLPHAQTPLYTESLRPQFHFTARQWTMNRLNPGMRQEGWINDLNGLIYLDGEYHLFAQRWAKCWLHAVSTDLVHWTELPPAFWEEELDRGVQSGTCVIDTHNTSGLSPNPSNPPLIAFWSRFDNKSQCLSFSLDRGRTWSAYAKNPIFVRAERDPKVFWYEPGKHWVMMLYGDQKYHILTSSNLLKWRDEKSSIPDCFECPDFFELPLDGDASRAKWVLIQGDGRYSIGSFDGRTFREETPRLSCDIGPNFYATQSWANTEAAGRRVQAAWMRGGVYPGMPFNQQVSFPCELTLHSTPDGPRIRRNPVREIATLQGSAREWNPRTLNAGAVLPLSPSGDLFRILAEVEISAKAKLTFNLRGEEVSFTASSLRSGGAQSDTKAPVHFIEILLDRTSIETFVNHGEVSSSRCILPRESSLWLKADEGPVSIRSLTIYPLRSAWPASH